MVTKTIRQAVVLAGGRGTRLGSLTDEKPKPLLDVGERPFIEWILMNLHRHGVGEVILTVGYRADTFHAWRSALETDLRVDLFEEDVPLDTGGALCELADRLDDTFFVLNGDTLFDVPLVSLSETLFAVDGDPPLAAVALRQVEDTARYGSVQLSDGRVTSFSEKASEAAPGWINGGVYAMRRAAFIGYESPLSIERTLMPELVEKRRVTALPCDGFFIDIGLPETLLDAQERIPQWWRNTMHR